jgi:SAM-dependent methyltransferase
MNQSAESSEPGFWDVRYASGKTPWDFRGIPAALKGFLSNSKPTTALIPGCGTGYEVAAFHAAGWEVTAIDFSPVAVEQAKAHLGPSGKLVVQGDFFAHDLGEHKFDVIYERTFLCALPPTIWTNYANRMAHLLRPGGRLVGFFLFGDEPEPPPYPLTETQAKELFSGHFVLRRDDAVVDSLPLFAGKERWQEWERNAGKDL